MLAPFMSLLEGISSAFLAFMAEEVLYSSILFVIVLILNRLLRKQSLHLQYGLLVFVFLRLLLPPGFAIDFSARSLLSEIELPQIVHSTSGQSALTNDAAIVVTGQGTSPWRQANSSLALSPEVEPDESSPAFSYFAVSVFLVWLVGVAALAVTIVRRYAFYKRVVSRARMVTESRVLKVTALWRTRFEIKRPVRVVASDHCLSPFTIGIFRPIVYLPLTMLTKSSDETLESVVAHELAHVRNFDDFWIKLQNIVQLVYFFHPVVWLANSRLNEIRERVCDEQVLSCGKITPRTYGSSMLAVLKLNLLGPEGVDILPGFGNHKKKFSLRIREISGVHRAGKPNWLLNGIALTAFAVLVLPMAQSSGGLFNGAEPGDIIRLTRMRNGDGALKVSAAGAGSKFEKISDGKRYELFCQTRLPAHLSDFEYAAIGLYDSTPRKIWVVKGINSAGEPEFYVDTDGDSCFTDEEPLKVRRKTAKYHYEDSPDWVLAKYLKSRADIDYKRTPDADSAEKLGVFLVYRPESNYLEFYNIEFWQGEAQFGDQVYPVALYGGLHMSWFLRATLDHESGANARNDLRVDLNRNGAFEDVAVYDPATNEVIQENHCPGEPFQVDGVSYLVQDITYDGHNVLLKVGRADSQNMVRMSR